MKRNGIYLPVLQKVIITFKTKYSLVFIEVAFLLLVFNGCNLQPGKRSNDPASFITIDITEFQDNHLVVNEIIKSVKFIPLEFKEECPISSISKLDFYNDTIFVLSRDGLYLFTTEGKFICQFARKGQGPGEYILPIDFSIDKQNKQ